MMMLRRVFVTVLVFLALYVAQIQSRTLQFTIIVHRHGARTPLYSLPQVKAESSKLRKGELTAVGHRQMYTLGQHLRQRYIEDHRLLSKDFSMGEIIARSSEYTRTILSVSSLLQGLYPAGSGLRLSESQLSSDAHLPPISTFSGWVADQLQAEDSPFDFATGPAGVSLVPIATWPSFNDTLLLGMTGPRCPTIHELYDRFRHDEAWLQRPLLRAVWDKHAAALGAIKERYNLSHPHGVATLADNLLCEKWEGEPLGDGQLSPEEVEAAVETLHASMSDVFGDAEISSVGGSHFYTAVGEALQAKAMGKRINLKDLQITSNGPKDLADAKMLLLSAHDVTLLAVLGFIGYSDGRNPPFASSVALELWKDDAGEASVSVWYNGKPIKPLGCKSTPCSLSEFTDFIGKRMPDFSYTEWCSQSHLHIKKRHKHDEL